jgi:predicted dinucleotide-binding enzyme
MRNTLLTLLALVAAPLLLGAAMKPVPKPAETIAIIGTGRVGGALGPQFAKLGHHVIYGSREPGADRIQLLVAKTGAGATAELPPKAAAQAQIVVLAVPWKATEDTVKALGDLAGKTVIDATNPFKFGPGGQVTVAADTASGELIQGWAPKAWVVKAFNAVGYNVMADPKSAGGPVTIPLAGNDAAAKKRVAELVEAMGFETVDVGSIGNARYLEGMAVLYITPYMSGRPQDAFEYHLRKRATPLTGPVRPAG